MPYITQKRRDALRDGECPENVGELNYKITKAVLGYLSALNYDKLVDKLIKNEGMCAVNSYADYNEVIGVLECCKLEVYRKLISKYEDKKCEENGDIFE